MTKLVLLIGSGGFIGSVSRFYCQQAALRYLPLSFPWGTFVINVLGSFLIGLIYGMAEKGGWMTPEWRFFLATGFCGGYTTFSTFSFESLALMREGNYMSLALYIAGSVVLGIAAAFFGVSLVK